MSRTKPVKIKDLQEGFVETQGIIAANSYLKTPLSNSDCVYYCYSIEHYIIDIEGDWYWQQVNNEEKSVPFYIRDETGFVYIDTKEAVMTAPLKNLFYGEKTKLDGPVFNLKTKKLADGETLTRQLFLNNYIIQIDNIYANETKGNVGDQKHFEKFLAPGDFVHVLGTAQRLNGETNNMIITKGSEDSIYLITHMKASRVFSKISENAIAAFISGLCFIGFGFLLIWAYFNLG